MLSIYNLIVGFVLTVFASFKNFGDILATNQVL